MIDLATDAATDYKLHPEFWLTANAVLGVPLPTAQPAEDESGEEAGG